MAEGCQRVEFDYKLIPKIFKKFNPDIILKDLKIYRVKGSFILGNKVGDMLYDEPIVAINGKEKLVFTYSKRRKNEQR